MAPITLASGEKERFSHRANVLKSNATVRLTNVRVIVERDGAKSFSVKLRTITGVQSSGTDCSMKITFTVTLKKGNSSTKALKILFTSPSAATDREHWLRALQPYIPPPPPPPPPHLSEKTLRLRASLLARDPEIKKAHTEMVVSNLISEEDFWRTRQRDLIRQDMNQQQQADSGDAKVEDATRGVVTANRMYHIFQKYPSVKKAYHNNVPHVISEHDFWSRFFQYEAQMQRTREVRERVEKQQRSTVAAGAVAVAAAGAGVGAGAGASADASTGATAMSSSSSSHTMRVSRDSITTSSMSVDGAIDLTTTSTGAATAHQTADASPVRTPATAFDRMQLKLFSDVDFDDTDAEAMRKRNALRGKVQDLVNVDPQVDLTSADSAVEDVTQTEEKLTTDPDLQRKSMIKERLLQGYNDYGMNVVAALSRPSDTSSTSITHAVLRSEDGSIMSSSQTASRQQQAISRSMELLDLQDVREPEIVALDIHDRTGYFSAFSGQVRNKRNAILDSDDDGDGDDDDDVDDMEDQNDSKRMLDLRVLGDTTVETLSKADEAIVWIKAQLLNEWHAQDKKGACRIDHSKVVDSTAASKVLVAISQQSKGLARATEAQQHAMVSQNRPAQHRIFSMHGKNDLIMSDEFKQLMLTLYRCAKELLRHWWSCFPPKPHQKTKSDRLSRAIDTLYSKVQRIRRDLNRSDNAAYAKVLKCIITPLEQVFRCAEQANASRKRKADAALGHISSTDATPSAAKRSHIA
jgi:BSD domain